MDIARTPDDRFATITDWPYAPVYTNVNINDGSNDTLRIHHVDEGPRDAHETILLMHGEPSWGYLYRHMMKIHIAAGHRVVVPDLVGFGRSDFCGQCSEVGISGEDGLFCCNGNATFFDGVAEHIVLKDITLVVTD